LAGLSTDFSSNLTFGGIEAVQKTLEGLLIDYNPNTIFGGIEAAQKIQGESLAYYYRL